jgi:sugar O-acyltransferase (sialic acid O-acetyltransferase NeuD family)
VAKRLVILGTGGFAEEVADYIAGLPQWRLEGFVEGIDHAKCGSLFLGLPVTWIDDVGRFDPACVSVCAVGSTRREAFIAAAAAHGLRFTTLVHSSAQLFASATAESGAIIGAGAVIGARTRIGAHTIVNRGSLIGHHGRIGEYVTIGPGCNIAAKVDIGDGTCLGMGAIVVDGVRIGAGCTIAAGSIITRDLAAAVKVAGGRARVLQRGAGRT